MDKDKNSLKPPRVCDVVEIDLQPSVRKPALQKDSKPDLRLIALVKLLARQAAKDQFKLELIASEKVKKKTLLRIRFAFIVSELSRKKAITNGQ